jgi:hypothetical protein
MLTVFVDVGAVDQPFATSTFTAGGAVVRGLGIGIATVFFNGSTAWDVGGGGFYDNPYN